MFVSLRYMAYNWYLWCMYFNCICVCVCVFEVCGCMGVCVGGLVVFMVCVCVFVCFSVSGYMWCVCVCVSVC